MSFWKIIKTRKFISIFVLVVFCLFLGSMVLGFSVMKAIAQTNSKVKVTPAVEITVTPTENLTPTPTPTPTKVDYYLPYPGILPDHPLYFIKAARDKVRLWLTRDPIKKTELMLIYADKRLGAGKALVEGGKPELGISTLTKGEKYLEMAVNQAVLVKEQGKDVTDLYRKLSLSALKHKETLNELLPKVSDNGKDLIIKTINYPQQGYEKINK